jgi:hypothetical protein
MLDKPQSQDVGAGGAAIQAGGNVTVITGGLSYSDIRAVALEVFQTNFQKLALDAATVARGRAEEITDKFLTQLQQESPRSLHQANDPAFQSALLDVQREYAKCGDRELGALLVDLLVQRSKQDQRNLIQLVLNESLVTAPKITEDQLCALTVAFLVRHVQGKLRNLAELGKYLDRYFMPFAGRLPKGSASYQHLEFAGCGAVGVMTVEMESAFQEKFRGLFQKGFDPQKLNEIGLSLRLPERFIVKCLHDPTKLQVNALNGDVLKDLLDANQVSPAERSLLKLLFAEGSMDPGEVLAKCIELRPYMQLIFNAWKLSPLPQLTLTSVGIAIAHANLRRITAFDADLSLWIN